EEGEEEARGREGDRDAEHDLDQPAEAARGLAEGEAQSGDDDDNDGDDLRDRPLDRVEDLLQGLLPGHVGASRQDAGWQQREGSDKSDSARQGIASVKLGERHRDPSLASKSGPRVKAGEKR